jgi:hypothetical protein
MKASKDPEEKEESLPCQDELQSQIEESSLKIQNPIALWKKPTKY